MGIRQRHIIGDAGGDCEGGRKKNIPVRYFTEELEEMPCAN